MGQPKTPAFAVFSGGGAQGIALAGAYQAARDSGFEFKGFGGTSAGAMIALMAATGMSGNDIVEQSLPGAPGHPSNFFSDPESRGHTERKLSRVLTEWTKALPKRKAPRKNDYEDEATAAGQTSKDKSRSALTAFEWMRHLPLTFVTMIVLAAAIVCAGLVVLAFATNRTPQETLFWLDLNFETDFEPLLKIAFMVLLVVVVFLLILKAFSGLRNFPLYSFLLLFPRGRYWKWVWLSLSRNYGFLRGTGMRDSFDKLFADKIRLRAEEACLKELEGRRFSDLTFREFEVLFGVPIKIVASDLWSGKPIVFDSHDYPNYRVFEAVRASTAFPLAFEPVVERTAGEPGEKAKIAHVLVDGGLSSNSPAFLYKRESDFSRIPTIAFQLNYSYPGPYYPEDLISYFNSLTRTAVGAGDTIIQGLVPRMHVVSVSGLEEYGVLDGNLSRKAILRLFELGKARYDDLVRIWKLCRIERQERGGLQREYQPVMASLQTALARTAGPGASVTIGLWVPDDHNGRGWRLIHKEGRHKEFDFGHEFYYSGPENGATFKRNGSADTLPDNVGSSSNASSSLPPEVNGLKRNDEILRLKNAGRFCAATALRALYSRDFVVADQVPNGCAMAFPVFSYTLEPDTWLRGRDIVAVLSAIAVWDTGAPDINRPLTVSTQDSRQSQNSPPREWLAERDDQGPEPTFAIKPELASEMQNWMLALSRFIVA